MFRVVSWIALQGKEKAIHELHETTRNKIHPRIRTNLWLKNVLEVSSC
jgi:hypothetical protein